MAGMGLLSSTIYGALIICGSHGPWEMSALRGGRQAHSPSNHNADLDLSAPVPLRL
ncbi:hypothetical protein HGRIS_013966 [Hohenbuehelia grisea]|uniref:Uncharacterized protein n=1 Tax=Hohenbuehelia grisea TaxID=104357 RepID=A0ABR3JSL0_9AGAR